MRKFIIIATLLLTPLVESNAQEKPDSLNLADSLTKEFLDTVNLKKKILTNDYSSFGFQYGVGLNRMMFNPTKSQSLLMTPMNFGVTFTKYCKMFGYMPYFGFQMGLFYGQDGYKTKYNKDTDSRPDVDGAYQAVYDYVEVPMLAIFHVDVLRFRVLADLGLYGGYRMNVHREGEEGYFDTEYADKFYDYDERFDYGIKGGAGFSLLFDPIEFYVQGQVKYGFSSLYEPDYASQYYYRYAYPFDIIISAGIQVQLTKRLGKTKSQLRKEAKELVINKYKGNENTQR